MTTKIKTRKNTNGLAPFSSKPHIPSLPQIETKPQIETEPQSESWVESWPENWVEEMDNVFLGDPDDPFYYGYRILSDEEATGEELYSHRPLTLDDFLDPEEGDVFMQGTLHHQDTEALFSIFDYLHEQNPSLMVYSDLKIIWGIDGLSNPAPDVSIIPDVKKSEYPRQTFEVAKEGTRPLFVLEVVSPRYRQADRSQKGPVYQRAGVKEYFIIDSHLTRKRGETETTVQYEILGYRLEAGQYVDINPNEQGWLYSEVNQVWIGVNETKDGFFVRDAQTDKIILPLKERAAAEAQRVARAEEQVKVEAERAEAAETRVKAEAERAEAAEKQAAAEAQRAEVEAIARSQAEAKLTALEAELRKLSASDKA